MNTLLPIRSRRRLLHAAVAAVFAIPMLAPTPVPAVDGNGDKAFTMWGFFHNPDDSADLVYLSGQRVQSNGRASFAGSYGEGSTIGGSGVGLGDADGALVVLILRSHGSYDSDIGHEQLTSFGGGCDVDDCEDLQFAAFIPDGTSEQQTPVINAADNSIVDGAWAVLNREEDGIRFSLHTRVN